MTLAQIIGSRTTGLMGWSDLRHAAASAGSHWFDAESMRFFGTRLPDMPRIVVRNGRTMVAFISSERDRHPHGAWNGKRRWTVRAFDGEHVHSIGDFGAHRTLASARRALLALEGGAA